MLIIVSFTVNFSISFLSVRYLYFPGSGDVALLLKIFHGRFLEVKKTYITDIPASLKLLSKIPHSNTSVSCCHSPLHFVTASARASTLVTNNITSILWYLD